MMQEEVPLVGIIVVQYTYPDLLEIAAALGAAVRFACRLKSRHQQCDELRVCISGVVAASIVATGCSSSNELPKIKLLALNRRR